MADLAFNGIAPQTSAVVMDTAPIHLRSIQDYLTRRGAFLGAGVQAGAWSTSGSPPTAIVPLLTNTEYYTHGLTYDNPTGVFSLGTDIGSLTDQLGYYRVSGFWRRYFTDPTASCGLALQKSIDGGASWISIAEFFYQPDTFNTSSIVFDAVIAMEDVSYLFRLVQVEVTTGASDSGVVGSSEESAQLIIEYLRPMTVFPAP